MQNKLMLLLPLLLLGGCATQSPPGIQTVIQRVEVPIAVPCKARIPDVPEFNFDQLTVEQSIHDKTKAVLADRYLHLGYQRELLAALNSCIK